MNNAIRLQRMAGGWKGFFSAMASPCEVLMEIDEEADAREIVQAVANEAWRIEQKFSRYRDDNIIYKINHSTETITVDDETARLIQFGDALYQMSEGLFDITSGVLRKAWRFDGSDNIPSQQIIDDVMRYVGWHRVVWQAPEIKLEPGMEIDLGGIGKEYAVDTSIRLVRTMSNQSVLVNFGGDLAVTRERRHQAAWSVGRLITGKDHAVSLFELKKGAIATSGDAHRYLLKDGVRYSHVLNPKTGWPVECAPHTVSVAGPTCVEAGMLSTLAMLQGARAKEFLECQGVQYWID